MSNFIKFGNYKINNDFIKYVYAGNDSTCNVVIKNTSQYGDGRNLDVQREFQSGTKEYQDCVNFVNQREKQAPIFNIKY